MMFEDMKSMERKFEPDSGIGDHEPVYPFNLSMTLEGEQIEALGLDCEHEDCQVGNYIHMHVLAEIKGVHKTDNGTSLNLQVSHMCIENESEEEEDYDEEQGRAVYGE